MKNCAKCKSEFPYWVLIDGKRKNLQNRKYCLECSPFGNHNTSKLEIERTNRKDSYAYQKKRGFERKKKLVNLYGGCCKSCGYNKNLAVLHFHHRDPKEKVSKLDVRIITNRTWDYCINEANKCDILCANCHAEHHHPDLNKWAGLDSNQHS